MEDLEHGYPWNEYVTSGDLPEVPGGESTRFIQAIKNDNIAKIKWLFPPDAWNMITHKQRNIWMYIYEASRVLSNSSGVFIFQQKNSKSGQYGGISRKESNNPRMQRQTSHTAQDEADYEISQDAKERDKYPPEDFNLTSFEEDKYSKHQKHWMSNIKLVNFSTTRPIVLSSSKQDLCFAMNLNTKGKWKLMVYSCAGKIVAAIGNFSVGVLQTARNFT